MSKAPSSQEDGPVTVVLTDGTEETYDRISYSSCGLIDFYDLDKTSTYPSKGDNAVTYPTHRIKEIQYKNYNKY